MLSGLFKALFPSRDAEQLTRSRLDNWHVWLEPVPGENRVGRDPGYEDSFFQLKDESGKLTGINDALIIQSCEQLIRETGKDLRLAGYYAGARLRQDGPAGFADGLELTAALMEQFGEAILPARAEAKKGALEMLATTRMMDLLESRGGLAASDLERALAALDVIVTQSARWPEAARPELQPLIARFSGKEASADAGVGPAPTSSTPVAGIAPAGATVSARDLLEQARAMARWLRDQEQGYLPSARLLRCIRWDTLHEVPPSNAASHTRLAAPRPELRQQLKRLVLQKQWHELLERVEGAFLEGVNHLWFDLQYFQHIALDHAGAPYDTWRALLRADFALFLERLPGIERLAFNDGTPFADDMTLEWIARHAVVRDLEAGEAVAPLPVSADSDGDGAGHWTEIETQAQELAGREGIEVAFAWLDALPGMKTERHRYLQRFVMARLAGHVGRADTAMALLAELDAAAGTLPLQRWDPALTFEVKLHLLRALKSAGSRKDADKPALVRRIAQVQQELILLDPARGLSAM